MDFNSDTPFSRFSAFWLGLGIVLIFALLLALIALFNRERPDSLEELKAEKRYETKAQVEAAQADALAPEAIDAAISDVAKSLADSKPVAVQKPEWVVPGSATAKQLEESEPIDPAVMELGKQSYLFCASCHGQEGEGVQRAGPPLANSEWVTGPVENLIRIQLRGLKGDITVAGKEYKLGKDIPEAGMIPMAHQSDEKIAAVLTYVRNSFGNKASAVTPDQVKALRSEAGQPPLTVEELIQP